MSSYEYDDYLFRNTLKSFNDFFMVFNRSFDTFFYELKVLTKEEITKLEAHTSRNSNDSIKDGSVIVVKQSSGKEEIVDELNCYFLAKDVSGNADAHQEEFKNIDTVVVAGVGSSVFGTAALARKVANIIKKPVAGIVSGYGINNVIEEGLQGWCDLRNLNRHHHEIACSIDNSTEEKNALEMRVNEIPEIKGLNSLLTKDYCKIKNFIGHSKGNLIIANTLYNLLENKKLNEELKARLKNYRVLTLGAVVYFPKEFTQVYQYIGSLDNFGYLNSRWCAKHGMSCIKRNIIDYAWHHLDPFLPFADYIAMPFEEIFTEVFPRVAS